MISALFGLVVRVVLTIATIVLVLGLMAVALVTMLFVIIVSLLSGKKPKIDVSGFKRAQQFRAGAPRAAQKSAGEVIDVEVREVPEQPPRPLK
jgi:uncharacterized protein (DUF58 family)